MEKSVLLIAREAPLALIRKYEKKNKCKISDTDMYDVIMELSTSYTDYRALCQSSSVDFNDRRYQAAYMFQYFSTLCYSVGYGIRRLNLDPSVWHQEGEQGDLNLKVCSIGGGPGTDVLGLYIYLQSLLKRRSRNVVLDATVIDKYRRWKGAWRAVKDQLRPIDSDRIHIRYRRHDINCLATEGIKSRVSEADIILMYKFVSAAKGLRHFKHNLKCLLRNASKSSYLIYGDNLHGGNTEVLLEIASASGFKVIKKYKEKQFNPVQEEEYLDELVQRYEYNYQKLLDMQFMILKKD
ncbi:uncharacterized protein [Antedon mediterranea]|uniref:uncharacterized protein n=1 Tax=Antedon mediterranea TaxID=105859 RepID=UPI003AF6E017